MFQGIRESALYQEGSTTKSFTYFAMLKPNRNAGGFTVTFRDLPEAITQGEDVADAVWQGADCLEEALAGRIRRDDSIPEPSKTRKGEYAVPVPALMAAKAAHYLAMKEADITKVQLAKRLKCDEQEFRLPLDPQRDQD